MGFLKPRHRGGVYVKSVWIFSSPITRRSSPDYREKVVGTCGLGVLSRLNVFAHAVYVKSGQAMTGFARIRLSCLTWRDSS